ncbi:hypothetical protein Hsw_2412 [Hymenobacter swuensis DY53]|uniref:Uncharacterized protein n=1 Tax=Hymenobacter swuensis DY53 TaxID=1227739 RepID=W8F1X7_9BACT|nr:hypothetical protein Hsw_2412 [Hymenobacter swuensis DY53]
MGNAQGCEANVGGGIHHSKEPKTGGDWVGKWGNSRTKIGKNPRPVR